MTHYTRKVKCPHCNNWSVVSYTSGMKENVYKGSPLRICDKCGKAYFDMDMEEEAISYYLGTHRFDGFGMTLIWAILGLAGGVFCLKDGEGIVAAILLVIGAFFSYGAIKILSETPDKVRNNLQCGKNLPADVEESLSRLSDINYLSFLTNNGYQVPDWFFERINVVNPKKKKKKTASSNQTDSTAPDMSKDYYDELLKLNELYQKNIITKDEFDAKKKQLLGL